MKWDPKEEQLQQDIELLNVKNNNLNTEMIKKEEEIKNLTRKLQLLNCNYQHIKLPKKLFNQTLKIIMKQLK